MDKSKKYFYTWEDEDKSANDLFHEMLKDDQLKDLEKIVIGNWGESWEESCQAIIDGIVEHKIQFEHIKGLFIGDMDYEECEVSWIIQGNYEKLWGALPNLKELTIKGSTELKLGTIKHHNLESLEIICGGLPKDIINQIKEAKLPNLKKLNLYLGSDDYGFDGDEEIIKELLEHSDFPKLEYLGLNDSEIQDEVTEVVLQSKYMNQISTLDLSNGTLTDKGGELLLKTIPNFPNIKTLDLHFHYLSDDMMKKLRNLSVEIDLEEQNEEDDYDDDDGVIYRYAMLTE